MTQDASSQKEKGDSWALVGRLLRFSWHFKWRCLQVVLLQILVVTIGLLNQGFTGLAIDFLRFEASGAEPPKWVFGLEPPAQWSAMQVLFAIGGSMLAFYLVSSSLDYGLRMATSRLVHIEIVVRLRALVFDKLQRLSFRFFDENASGSIINRVTSDVQAVRMFIDGVIVQVVAMLLSLTVMLIMMLKLSVPLTLVCLATTPLLWLTTAWFSRSVKPAYRKNREYMDKLVLRFSENVSGINTVKGFSLEKHTTDNFRNDNATVRDHRRTIFLKVSTFGPFIGLLTQLNLVVLLGYGGYLVVQEEVSVGMIYIFAAVLQQFSAQVANIAGVADSVQQSLTGARRVFEIIDTPVEVKSPPKPVALPRARGEVAFEHVSFSFKGGDPVLRDIDFTVRPGQVVAIAGATGSGKSALMSLIPRFYDPQEGCVRLDGHDLRTLDVEELRRNIGVVFQENFLFSNTIRQNIAFGRPKATQEQIESAARIACAHDFILETPHGYNTILGESGVNLSGGQRQRLAIARAVLLEPSILILDDPTAAIDAETEHEILEAIERAIEGRTTFIVAHRLSTLRRADRIVVLRKGEIEAIGSHEELMGRVDLYRAAVEMQAVDPESWAILQKNLEGRHG